MNACKKVAFFENVASAITNQGDSENQKKIKQKNNNNNKNIRVHPTGFKTMSLWFTNADRSSTGFRSFIQGSKEKWRFCTLICEENMKRIVVRHKSYECLGLMLYTIVSNLLLCIW